MANAQIRSHDEYLSPVSLNLRGTSELQLKQTQPISQASGGPPTTIDDMLRQNWSTLHSPLLRDEFSDMNGQPGRRGAPR
jgi:hypothetical protein